MTEKSTTGRGESPDAQTAALVEAAHHCEALPTIDDYLPYRNFGDMWASLVSRWPERRWMAYYHCDEENEEPEWITYGQFSELLDRVAALLASEYHISAGCTIATMTISQTFTAALYFAAWRLGARVVPIDPRLPDERVAEIITNAEVILLIVHTATREDLGPLDAVLDEHLQCTLILDGAHREDALTAGWDDFNAALDEVDLSTKMPGVPDVSWDADALVVHEPGRDDPPKGVVLTQKQLFAEAYAICQWHGINEHSVIMNVLPLPDVNGVVMTLVVPAFVGARAIINRRFRIKGFWEKITEHDVEIVSLAPPLLEALLESDQEIDRAAMPNFRHIICGGGSLSVELTKASQERFGLKIAYGYRRPETGCYASFLPADLEWHEHARWMYGQDVPSIGGPIAVNDMAVHGVTGEPVPDGEKGELVVRGHNIMAGFLNDPEADAASFVGGWFRTRDEGFKLRGKDGRDYYFVTGRIEA